MKRYTVIRRYVDHTTVEETDKRPKVDCSWMTIRYNHVVSFEAIDRALKEQQT